MNKIVICRYTQLGLDPRNVFIIEKTISFLQIQHLSLVEELTYFVHGAEGDPNLAAMALSCVRSFHSYI